MDVPAVNVEHVYTTSVDGTPVIIYNTEAGGLFPVHGAYLADDEWYLACWTKEGRRYITEPQIEHPLDLIEAYID